MLNTFTIVLIVLGCLGLIGLLLYFYFICKSKKKVSDNFLYITNIYIIYVYFRNRRMMLRKVLQFSHQNIPDIFSLLFPGSIHQITKFTKMKINLLQTPNNRIMDLWNYVYLLLLFL